MRRPFPPPLRRPAKQRTSWRLLLPRQTGTRAHQAGARAVNLLLSGPAGGIAGAALLARQTNRSRMLTFDMGGTSTDVSLVDGSPTLIARGQISGLPIHVPMTDIHTIGAGGGSVAYVDGGGLLRVGPRSAGAIPAQHVMGEAGRSPLSQTPTRS